MKVFVKVVKCVISLAVMATGLLFILDKLVEWLANSEYAASLGKYPDTGAVHPYTDDDDEVVDG